MYIAKKPLKTYDKNGVPTIFKVGDPVPNFDEWNHNAKHVHLKHGHVEFVPDVEEAHKAQVAKPTKGKKKKKT